MKEENLQVQRQRDDEKEFQGVLIIRKRLGEKLFDKSSRKKENLLKLREKKDLL